MSKVEYLVALAISAIISIVLMGSVVVLFESSSNDTAQSNAALNEIGASKDAASAIKLAAIKGNTEH